MGSTTQVFHKARGRCRIPITPRASRPAAGSHFLGGVLESRANPFRCPAALEAEPEHRRQSRNHRVALGVVAAEARKLGQAGARVLVHGCDAERGARVIAEIKASGGAAKALRRGALGCPLAVVFLSC
ncbi:MAG TPA: hypothetical protein VGK96_25765 [Candidatus Sulfotelmatobacter sp.]